MSFKLFELTHEHLQIFGMFCMSFDSSHWVKIEFVIIFISKIYGSKVKENINSDDNYLNFYMTLLLT